MHVNVTGSLALFGRLFAYIDRVPEMADDPGLGQVQGAIRFDGVSFSYPGASRAALSDLTVNIEPGQPPDDRKPSARSRCARRFRLGPVLSVPPRRRNSGEQWRAPGYARACGRADRAYRQAAAFPCR
jgi:hypothetical protein